MANFFHQYNKNGQLGGISKNFANSRHEMGMTNFRNSTYVHISNIRKCFVGGQFDLSKKETVSMTYEDMLELRSLLDDFPTYRTTMMAVGSQEATTSMTMKAPSSMKRKLKDACDSGPVTKKQKLDNLRLKLVRKDGEWKRCVGGELVSTDINTQPKGWFNFNNLKAVEAAAPTHREPQSSPSTPQQMWNSPAAAPTHQEPQSSPSTPQQMWNSPSLLHQQQQQQSTSQQQPLDLDLDSEYSPMDDSGFLADVAALDFELFTPM